MIRPRSQRHLLVQGATVVTQDAKRRILEADVLITGTVFASDVDSWLQSLETVLPVRVVLAPDGSVRLESR